jgi:hypothetical protein
MKAQYAAYDTIPGMMTNKPMLAREAPTRKRAALPVLVGCLLVPWLLFTTTFWLRSFELRRDSEALVSVLCYCLLLPVLAFAYMTFNLMQTGDPTSMAFLTKTSLLAWVAGYCLGNSNFQCFMKPYYDITNLNVYPSVDPAKFTGNQLMDAGMIQFTKGSSINIEKSMGFKNDDIYCVAPIIGTNSTPSNYDFWAVGLNCCSGHVPDFKCGEYTNPSATWGLRLMDDRRRDMFRLAVKEAEATFDLKAPHPVFLYWLADPMAEVNAYQDDGFKYFTQSVFGFAAIQLFLVACSILVFAKI